MDASSVITGTGTSQSATQNPQNIGTQSLIPTTANLQPGASSSTNINTSSSTAIAIPLDSVSTGSVKSAYIAVPKTSNTPYLVGFGTIIIVGAIIGMLVSNIISSRRLAID